MAHPDDEVIGASVLFSELPRILLVSVTDGAPRDLRDARAAGCDTREAYAALRSAERRDALSHACGCDLEIIELGIIDQEASSALVQLTQRLDELLLSRNVTTVVTHAYEGGHPDHDATAFAVHAAARLRAPDARLTIVELTGYHAGRSGMITGEFLPYRGAGPVHTVQLCTDHRACKARMIAAYHSQRNVLAPFQLDFERFRVAPEYDFGEPPHEGKVWYEWFGWGMPGGGREWRALAAAAADMLGTAVRPTAAVTPGAHA